MTQQDADLCLDRFKLFLFEGCFFLVFLVLCAQTRTQNRAGLGARARARLARTARHRATPDCGPGRGVPAVHMVCAARAACAARGARGTPRCTLCPAATDPLCACGAPGPMLTISSAQLDVLTSESAAAAPSAPAAAGAAVSAMA